MQLRNSCRGTYIWPEREKQTQGKARRNKTKEREHRGGRKDHGRKGDGHTDEGSASLPHPARQEPLHDSVQGPTPSSLSPSRGSSYLGGVSFTAVI